MRRPYDNYNTVPQLAEWIVRRSAYMAPPAPNSRFLEPCCGDGAPFAAAAARLGLVPYGFDIREVRPAVWSGKEFRGGCASKCSLDAFMTGKPFGAQFDFIATNPPFNFGEQVVRRSIELLDPLGCAAFLVKLNFLGTYKRSALFVKYPPTEVVILRARPSFTGDGGTDIAQEYAVVFWHGDTSGGTGRTTRLRWLNNKAWSLTR